RTALSLLQPSALALRPYRCPLCGPGLLLRLSRDGIGVRCMRCGASAITQSLVAVLRSVRPDFEGRRVYEMSSRGALFEFLRRAVVDFTCSEYFDDVPPGDRRGGVLCQDVQRLTVGDGSFDICTSTEVFEHVPDDRRGFAEIRRVLAPGGAFMFTVPLSDSPRTVERAVLAEGGVRYILPPTYHHDRIRGREQVLVYRDYGQDITQRLVEAGFARAYIDRRFERAWLGAGCGVIVAEA
ncbi:MAG: methyltransferase domain-containing protein, partial [Burkholderiales bacterium]